MVPQGHSPSALPELWIQIRRCYTWEPASSWWETQTQTKVVQVSIWDLHALGLNPRFIWHRLPLSSPPQGQQLPPVIVRGGGRAPLLGGVLTSAGGPAQWPYHQHTRPGQRYPDPIPSCLKLCSPRVKYLGFPLPPDNLLLNVFSQSENIYY